MNMKKLLHRQFLWSLIALRLICIGPHEQYRNKITILHSWLASVQDYSFDEFDGFFLPYRRPWLSSNIPSFFG